MTIQRTEPKVVSTTPNTTISSDPIKIITEGSELDTTDPIIFKEDIDIKNSIVFKSKYNIVAYKY